MFAFFRKKSGQKRILGDRKLSNMQNLTQPEIELKLIDKHDGWSTIFQHICAEAQERFELSFSDSRRIEYKIRNRYKDISPYDHSRIRLKRDDIDYINASRVEVPQVRRSYILTQGPLPQTVSHFWVMVLEKNCPAIVMLNRYIEKDQTKCHPYFPLEGEPDLLLDDVDLKVSYVAKKNVTDHFVARLLAVEDLRSGKKCDVLHYHYLVWPDFGVPPSPDSFLELLFAVRDGGILDNPARPVVVHCSAGVGRSGVFCIVDACLKMAEDKGSGESVDLRATLIDMRRFRMGLIQTPEQLRFAYMALVEALKRMNLTLPGSSLVAVPEDLEERFVTKNFATTPTHDPLEEEEEEEEEDAEEEEELAKLKQDNATSSNSFGNLEPAGIPLRAPKAGERRGRKRCSLGRFAPHPGSVEDPESVWLFNNTVGGEPLVGPGNDVRPDGCDRPKFSSVDEKFQKEICHEEEDGYYGDREGSGVDEGSAESSEDGEMVEECLYGCNCSEASDIRRRPLNERAKKSWEELDRMAKQQEKCEELMERRRKAWKVKVVGWSVVVLLLGVALYRSI